MKTKIRKSGEIVNIISYYETFTENYLKYNVVYIDSLGVQHSRDDIDYNEYFESIEETQDKHWQDVRERAAIAALQGLLANPHSFYSGGTMKEDIVPTALSKGDALAWELEEEQKEEERERNEVKKVDLDYIEEELDRLIRIHKPDSQCTIQIMHRTSQPC